MATLELPKQSASKSTLAATVNLDETGSTDIHTLQHHGASLSTTNTVSDPSAGVRSSNLKGNKAFIRYIVLSTTAVGLTVASTLSYTSDQVDDATSSTGTETPISQKSTSSSSDSHSYLSHGVVYTVTLAILLRLYQSDPGYLTAEIIHSIKDGAAVDGTPLPDVEHSVTGNKEDTAEGSFMNTSSSSSSSSPSSSRRRFASEHISEEEEESQLCEPLTSEIMNGSVVAGNAKLAPTRRPYCNKCGFAPPLRSHHCKVCDCHVATFDHHCEFIGTCIGEKNHALFWWFLTMQACGFLVMMNMIGSNRVGWISLLVSSSSNNRQQQQDTQQALLVVAAEVYVYPLAWAAFLMWTIHTFLISTNSTTFEWSKKQHLEYLRGTELCDLPYSSQRCDLNLWNLCWRRNHQFPTLWKPPARVVRDSDQWWKHPWQNKYWSCC